MNGNESEVQLQLQRERMKCVERHRLKDYWEYTIVETNRLPQKYVFKCTFCSTTSFQSYDEFKRHLRNKSHKLNSRKFKEEFIE